MTARLPVYFLSTSSLSRAAGLCAAALVWGVAPIPAAAVTSAGQIDATIISALVPALSPIEELNFGEIIAVGPGNVTISPAGTPTLGPGLSLTPGSQHQPGVMRIIGMPGAVVDLNILPGAHFVDNGLGVTMPVMAFDIGNGPNNDHSVTIGASAIEYVNIGATLAVGIGQVGGSYTGTFTLNADYQ